MKKKMRNPLSLLNRAKAKVMSLGFFFALMLCKSTVAFADVNSEIIKPINNLKTLFTAIITAVGAVVLIWQIVSLALAIKRKDPAATTEAVLGVGAGLLLAAAPTVVTYILA